MLLNWPFARSILGTLRLDRHFSVLTPLDRWIGPSFKRPFTKSSARFGISRGPNCRRESTETLRGQTTSMTNPIPTAYHGWWRIVDTETWVNDGLDTLGPALLSL